MILRSSQSIQSYNCTNFNLFCHSLNQLLGVVTLFSAAHGN